VRRVEKARQATDSAQDARAGIPRPRHPGPTRPSLALLPLTAACKTIGNAVSDEVWGAGQTQQRHNPLWSLRPGVKRDREDIQARSDCATRPGRQSEQRQASITRSWGSTPSLSPPGNGIVGHPSESGEWSCCARPRPSFSRRCCVSIVLQAAVPSTLRVPPPTSCYKSVSNEAQPFLIFYSLLLLATCT
jgi:hypothetical protein